jgi:hypothetical protein
MMNVDILPQEKDVKVGRRKLHSVERHRLYSLPDIIKCKIEDETGETFKLHRKDVCLSSMEVICLLRASGNMQVLFVAGRASMKD